MEAQQYFRNYSLNTAITSITKSDLCSARSDRFPVSRGHLPVIPFRRILDFFPMTPEERPAVLEPVADAGI
jgi:diadenosine tetraphosphate (Ap4A) HIT family hydrolase